MDNSNQTVRDKCLKLLIMVSNSKIRVLIKFRRSLELNRILTLIVDSSCLLSQVQNLFKKVNFQMLECKFLVTIRRI